MMDSLELLQQKVASKKALEAKLRELQNQRAEYDRKIVSLRVAFREEQADAEKLEGRSLANYFLRVVGKMDEKLDQERREAYAAKVKLDAAERELAGIDDDIQQIHRQLSEVRMAREQYGIALERKRNELKGSDTPEAQKILEIEEQITVLEAYKREIQEAVSAGHSARATADRVLAELDSADNWNAWDMFGGGGVITHMAKHSHLDRAQDLTEELQSKLRRFKTELADVQITADTQVNIDGFLRFADYFFDGLFVDWTVGKRISQSQSSVSSTRSQISRVLEQLKTMEANTNTEIARLKAELEQFIVQA